MRIAYLDCFAGIAGDMFLGALIDAGVPPDVLKDAAEAMNLNASLKFERVYRSGISATKVHVFEGDQLAEASGNGKVQADDKPGEPSSNRSHHQHPHRVGHVHPHLPIDAGEPELEEAAHSDGRSLKEIRQLIQQSSLRTEVQQLAVHTFELLGSAEARIHNVDLEEIHFHEVGAVDAIVDIVASAAGIVYLQVDAWHCSSINVGGGTVRCAHGVFPVPAPATADLLRGVPTHSAHILKELVTPTGAALVRALTPSYGPQPAFSVDQIGYGAGTRNPPGFPNVLRLMVGESLNRNVTGAAANLHQHTASKEDEQTVSVLETTLDDATPQLLAYVAEQVLRHGALDVMLTPVIMKKGRPGTMLTVLATPEDTRKLKQLLLRETTTLGVRVRQDRRTCLARSHVSVQTAYGTIRVKVGTADGETLNANPEFEDCRKAAEANGAPLKHVQAAAMAAYYSQHAAGAKG